MAIKDSMILQLLDPEAARRLAEQEQRNQQMAMAQSRSPLLAEAAKTAGMFSSALGGALGRDMRSPMEKRAQNVQAAMATSGGNIVEAAKILQQSDPAAAMVLMQQGRAMQPKREVKQLRTGSTLQYPEGTTEAQILGGSVKAVAVPTYSTFQLEDGVITGRIDTTTGRVIPISGEERAALENSMMAEQAQADGTTPPKPDDTIGKGNIYLNAGMGTGVQQGAPTATVPPETQKRMEQQSGASRTARPSLSELIKQAGGGGAPAPVVARMEPVPERPQIQGELTYQNKDVIREQIAAARQQLSALGRTGNKEARQALMDKIRKLQSALLASPDNQPSTRQTRRGRR